MAEQAVKQQIFVYEGTDRQGKKVSGEMPAASDALVKAMLRRQGINPTRVRRKPRRLFSARKKKIIPKDIAVFSRQLATMITAGVPLVQSLEIIGRGHENPAMQDLVMSVRAEVEAGNTLASALAKHPRQFDDLFCNLVAAGEQAGVLETLLHKIATYKEKTEALKSKIKKALFYPTAVLITAFIITSILLIFVIPQFEELFRSFGGDLPAFTRLVIAISEFFQAWWWAIFGALIVGAYTLVSAHRRSEVFRRATDRLSLRIPVIGGILTKAAIARYCRTLSTMFAAGVPLVEAMESVAGATGNTVYGDAVLRMRDEIATGQQLTVAMRQTGLFPNMVVQMVAIGEESGALDDMLAKVADFYEQEVDDAVDALSSLLEPLIMAVLGILIGGLVAAMYLPIFKMGAVI